MADKLPVELKWLEFTPYELSKYLKDPKVGLNIDYSPQRMYRDVKDGRLHATKNKEGKWTVSKDEATRHLLKIINGGQGRISKW